jgi:hypothetical protein
MNPHPSAIARKLIGSASCLPPFIGNPHFAAQIKAAEAASMAEFYMNRRRETYQNTMRQVGFHFLPSTFFLN